MLVHGTCCGCLSLRKECIVFGLVDLITQIPHIAVDVDIDGDIAFVDLIIVIIGTLLSGLLVYGAVSRNLFCLWFWIILHIIRTLVFGVGLILLIIAMTTDAESNIIAASVHDEFDETEIPVIAVLASMQTAVYIFLMVLVYRYIRELRDDEANDYEESDDDSIVSEEPHWWSEFFDKITKAKWAK